MGLKHILFVANTSWSIYNFRYGVLCRLLSEGTKITILAPKDDYSVKLSNIGCDVVDLPMSPKGINPFEDMKLFFLLASIYRNINPDFIIHYTIKPNIYGSLAARLVNIPSLAVTTGLGYTFINSTLVAKIARLLYKISFKFPKEIWFLNEDDRASFLNYGLVEEDRAVLLHGEGVDMLHYHPVSTSCRDGKIRFLLIARMLWDKGVGEFVEAAKIIKKEYPQACFQLLGNCNADNPSSIDSSIIRDWEKDGVIEYLGMVDDVRPIIASADCVVLPSYREGIPRTMIESAAMGKPLIVSDAPGCRDVVIDNVTGFKCKVKDVPSLTKCCETIINMREDERISMGFAGRSFIKSHFDQELVIEQYLSTLKKYGVISNI
ncbi:glycosyltransferase family 4 protein [Aeromonas caviae]